MSRYAHVNLLDLDDSVAGRLDGLEGRFARSRLESRDSNWAAERTCEEAAPVSVAIRV